MERPFHPSTYSVGKQPPKIYCTVRHQVKSAPKMKPPHIQKKPAFNAPCHVSGSRFAMQDNGYFTSNTFPDTIRHLMANSLPGKKLFILDGHDSHLDVDALDL